MSWVVDGRFRRPKQMSHPADWIRDRMRLKLDDCPRSSLSTGLETPSAFRRGGLLGPQGSAWALTAWGLNSRGPPSEFKQQSVDG